MKKKLFFSGMIVAIGLAFAGKYTNDRCNKTCGHIILGRGTCGDPCCKSGKILHVLHRCRKHTLMGV